MRKVLRTWFLIFIVWSLYRAFFFFPEWVDELLLKPIVFLGPVFYHLKKEKKSWMEVGIRKGNLYGDIYLGLFLGFVFALEGLAANYLKYGRFSFATILALKGRGILFYLILSLATSFSEEVLGRGFFFTNLYKKSKETMLSAVGSSLLFLSLHLPIAFINLSSWTLIVYLLSVFILGVINSFLFKIRKTVTLPILVHCFWNMTVALYL